MTTPPPELADLLPSWLLSLRAQQRSPKTIQTYDEGVRAFLRWCDQTGTAPELTRRTVTQFIADILDRGVTPNTARSRHQAVKRFSAWLASEGEIAEDGLLGLIQPKVVDKITDPLTVTELQAIFKARHGKRFADRRDEAILRLMAETGMRAGECIALTVADIDLARGAGIIRRGKGGQGRVVPFGAATAAVLDRYRGARTQTSATCDVGADRNPRGADHGPLQPLSPCGRAFDAAADYAVCDCRDAPARVIRL